MSSYCTKYICQHHITRLPYKKKQMSLFHFVLFWTSWTTANFRSTIFCRNPITIITMKMMQWRLSWINHFILQLSSCSHCIKWGINSILVLSSSLSLPTTQMTQMKRSMKLTRVLIEDFLLFWAQSKPFNLCKSEGKIICSIYVVANILFFNAPCIPWPWPFQDQPKQLILKWSLWNDKRCICLRYIP